MKKAGNEITYKSTSVLGRMYDRVEKHPLSKLDSEEVREEDRKVWSNEAFLSMAGGYGRLVDWGASKPGFSDCVAIASVEAALLESEVFRLMNRMHVHDVGRHLGLH